MGILDDKVAIVTGAGRGLGLGEALEIARQGAAVVLNEYDEATGQAAVDQITEAGGRAVLVAGDVSEVEIGDRVVATAVEEFGGLDGLVNNAGILRDRTLAKMTPEEWDAVIKVHLRGHYTTTHAALNYWKDNARTGRIVNTASTSGILGNFGQGNYGAAKAGIAAFSTIVAQEGSKYGIYSNAIAPAARTAMTESAYGKIDGDDSEFDFWAPDNVAPFVAFLISDDAGTLSGNVFGVQGDTVELYQPYTSVGVLENSGQRWDPAQFKDLVPGLFTDSGLNPEAEFMMRKLRYTMANR